MGALFGGQTHDASPTTELFRIYVQYKKDTKAIISWLLSHQRADGPTTSPGKLSVRDLLAIAERICATAVAMPDVIAFQFRQAITARSHLSKAFRRVGKASGESASTENHEFFTARILAITPVGKKTTPAKTEHAQIVSILFGVSAMTTGSRPLQIRHLLAKSRLEKGANPVLQLRKKRPPAFTTMD
ncbi:MAG: hypothetical protein LQ346_000871 [Caloplaca aetnensis]|nr:MAG: hypothetical protein LQ346_000871 [Caloplaca aetnensis]